MTNEDIIDQLRYRSSKLNKMVEQQPAHLTELIRAELSYVNTLIDYRTKHGAPHLIDTKSEI